MIILSGAAFVQIYGRLIRHAQDGVVIYITKRLETSSVEISRFPAFTGTGGEGKKGVATGENAMIALAFLFMIAAIAGAIYAGRRREDV